MTPHSSVQVPEHNPCTSKPSVFHVWFLSWQESVSTHTFLIFYHPYLKKFTLQKSHWSIFVSGKKFLLNDGCIWSGNFFGRFPLGSNCNRSGEETAFSKHRPTVCFQREPWKTELSPGFSLDKVTQDRNLGPMHHCMFLRVHSSWTSALLPKPTAAPLPYVELKAAKNIRIENDLRLFWSFSQEIISYK